MTTSRTSNKVKAPQGILNKRLSSWKHHNMAEKKYDLLLVPTISDKTIRQQPWYKERLKTKYLKQRKRLDTSKDLIGRNWVLVRSGMDDFRSGKPLDFKGQFAVDGSKGISPIIKQSDDSMSNRLKREKIRINPRPELTRHQILFDKRLPQQRKRLDHINEIEYGLTQHPLALYPHLEEGMSPDLFEEIVDLVDPSMNPDIDSMAEGTPPEVNIDTSFPEQVTETNMEKSPTQEDVDEEEANKKMDEVKSRNPYKWILQKNNSPKEDKRGLKKRPTSPSQDEHIKKVTKQFCDWVSDLGGDSNNVEESTIMSLFASGYETKPALSVPIHVVELSNVPAELRMNAGASPPGSAKKSHISSANVTNTTGGEPLQYQPSWVKIKYGAWYLNPESWKVRPDNEPLEDPVEVVKREKSESKQKSVEMDVQLAPLHGAKAFRDFLERTGKRKPEFMDRVSQIQDIEAAKNEVFIQRPGPSSSRGLDSRNRSSTAGGSNFTMKLVH